MNSEIQCQICGRKFERKRSLTAHISAHQITSKDYFDRYIKTDKDGICLNCGLPTKWNIYKNIYSKFCLNDNKCYSEYLSKGNEMQNRIEGAKVRRQTLIERYGTVNLFEVPEINKKRKQTLLSRYGVEHISQIPGVQKMKEHGVKAKPYILPSGRVVYKRGYEPHLLDYIFEQKLFKETEIVFSPMAIMKKALEKYSITVPQ